MKLRTRIRPLALAVLAVMGAGAAVSAADAPPPTVEVIDPGKSPRRLLRYALVPGSHEAVVMQMGIQQTVKMNGNPGPDLAYPALKMRMEISLEKHKLGEHQARYHFVLRSMDAVPGPKVTPMVMKAMRQQLQSVVGMRGSAVVDDRGYNSDVQLQLPEDAPANLQQMVAQIKSSLSHVSSPLPESPVGVGARWRVHQVLRRNGVNIDQQAELHLVKLLKNGAELETKITQTAGKQAITPSPVPGGTAELLSMAGTGGGKVELRFSRLVPRRSKLSLASDTVVKVEAASQTATVGTHVIVELAIHGE